MERERVDFARASLGKYERYQEDPYIAFFCLWIGVNALYSQVEERYERDKIKTFFRGESAAVKEVIRDQRVGLQEIVDFVDREPQHTKLREFLGTRKGFLSKEPDDNSVVVFAEFLDKVRNNMFHAAKLWDDEIEAKLLRMVNPILEELLIKLVDGTRENWRR